VTGNGGSRRIRDLIGPITPITYVITLCTKQKLIAAVPNAKRPITPCAEIAFIGSGVKRATRKKTNQFPNAIGRVSYFFSLQRQNENPEKM
jgi:hypothetical protein